MALNYDDLVASKSVLGSLSYWMNWTLLDAPGALEDAQAFIYGLLRVREMRSSATLAIGLGDSTEPLPSDFLEPVSLWSPRSRTYIKPTHEAFLHNMQDTDSDGVLIDSVQTWYAIFDQAFNFDAKADEAVNLKLIYMKRPALLGPGVAGTNWLTVRYPNIVRAAALGHAWQQRINETESKAWLDRAVALIGAANAESDLSRMGADYPIEVRDG